MTAPDTHEAKAGHCPALPWPHIPVLPVLQALRRGSRLGTGSGIGSLSPMRTSATNSSMSSLLQDRGASESQGCSPFARQGLSHSNCPTTHSPGCRSRWLGTQVSGGSRTLTNPARKLSAAMSNTWGREERLHPDPDPVRTSDPISPAPNLSITQKTNGFILTAPKA